MKKPATKTDSNSAFSSDRTNEQPHPLTAEFERVGMRWHRFFIQHTSPHRMEDWDWNQRDVPHVPFVHGGFSAAPLHLGDDGFSAFTFQRLFGVRVPLLNALHHPSPDRRVYATALGPFALVVEASLERLPDTGTLVRTEYTVAAKRPFSVLFPLLERFMRRNYRKVFDEDEPLRRRRSELRSWGLRFREDEEGASYKKSMNPAIDRVTVPPATEVNEWRVRVDTLEPGKALFVGRSDHLGLRFVLETDRIAIYPRLCLHAGACLDNPLKLEGLLRCPWHGRKIHPLCTFDVRSGSTPRHATSAFHAFSFDGNEIRVTTAPSESASARSKVPFDSPTTCLQVVDGDEPGGG